MRTILEHASFLSEATSELRVRGRQAGGKRERRFQATGLAS